MLCGLAVTLTPTQTVLADDDARLEEIRAGYVQTITSMRNIWVRYEVHKQPSDKLLNAGRGNYPRKRIWDWAMDGEKFHLSCTASATASGEPYPPYWISADGKDRWKLQYSSNREIDHALKERLVDGTWELRDRVTPGRFLGLYFSVGIHNVRGLTLQAILETEPLTFGGAEFIEGHKCWRVDFVYPADSKVHEIPMAAYLDPGAGYLPRRLTQFSNSGGQPTLRTVLTFTTIGDPRGGAPLPFPSEMRDEHPLATSTLKVLAVKLNERFAPGLFRPQLAAGAKVYDLDDERQVEALRRKKAEPALAAARARRHTERAEQEKRTATGAAATPTIDARPQQTNYVAITLVIGGLAILTLFTVATLWRRS